MSKLTDEQNIGNFRCKRTDDEIIEVLNDLIHLGDAPIGKGYGVIIDKQSLSDVLDLINRLKAKNKEFDEKKVIQRGLIDRLKADNERMQKEQNQFADLGKMYSEIKTEAYKEFAEEFINYIDVGHLRDASEICLSELNVKNMVENFLKQKVGEV